MTTAKPPARYSAMERARSGDFATPELHHPILTGHVIKKGDVRNAEDAICWRRPALARLVPLSPDLAGLSAPARDKRPSLARVVYSLTI